MEFQTIPVIRIFDEARAKEFYLGFLDMNLEWEHRFEADAPIYMQVARGGLVLHLSEHSGDCSPGAKIFVNTTGLEAPQRELKSRRYRYNRPEISDAPWGGKILEVVDPFSNKILFNEQPDS